MAVISDSTGMWEEQEGEEVVDDEEDEEDEGLAGQLLSDLIASNKYGTASLVFSLGLASRWRASRRCGHSKPDASHVCFASRRLEDDEYYEDDEEDDPDALKDPLYQVDLQVQPSKRAS